MNLIGDIVIKMMKIKKMSRLNYDYFFCIWISYIQTNRTKDYNHQVPFNIQETPRYNQKDNVKKNNVNK